MAGRVAPAGSLLNNDDRRLARFWHPVARLDGLSATLQRVSLLDEGYVVWRGVDGTVHALRDRCPHRASRLSAGCLQPEGTVRCGYHGWRFAPTGEVVEIPALGQDAALPPSARVERPHLMQAHGLLFLAPAAGPSPEIPPITLPTPLAEGARVVWLAERRIATSAGQFIDNFCDFAHFPFVHAGTFGASEDATVGDFTMARHPDGYTLAMRHLAHNSEDPLVATGEHPLLQPRTMDYTYTVPFSASLRLQYPLSGLDNTIVTWAQPETAATTVVFTMMVRNDLGDGDDGDALAAAAIAYESDVLEEDVRILEAADEVGFELDVRNQAHTRADRPGIELRRALTAALAGRRNDDEEPQ